MTEIREKVEILLSPILEQHEAFLVDLSQRFVARGYASSDLELPMTREDIGSFLGLKLETVSRLFSKLRNGKLIEVQQRHIRILDMVGLKQLL